MRGISVELFVGGEWHEENFGRVFVKRKT